jgi:hypothetical protein
LPMKLVGRLRVALFPAWTTSFTLERGTRAAAVQHFSYEWWRLSPGGLERPALDALEGSVGPGQRLRHADLAALG